MTFCQLLILLVGLSTEKPSSASCLKSNIFTECRAGKDFPPSFSSIQRQIPIQIHTLSCFLTSRSSCMKCWQSSVLPVITGRALNWFQPFFRWISLIKDINISTETSVKLCHVPVGRGQGTELAPSSCWLWMCVSCEGHAHRITESFIIIFFSWIGIPLQPRDLFRGREKKKKLKNLVA